MAKNGAGDQAASMREEFDMGDKGKKDSVKREAKKKPKLTLKEKRKRRKEKKK